MNETLLKAYNKSILSISWASTKFVQDNYTHNTAKVNTLNWIIL